MSAASLEPSSPPPPSGSPPPPVPEPPLTLAALLYRTLGMGIGMGLVAVLMVPAWVCVVGMPLSGLAAVELLGAQLRVALPEARVGEAKDMASWLRGVTAGTLSFLGVVGYIAAVVCGSEFAQRLTGMSPESHVPTGLLTLLFASGYCVALAPFAFAPLIVLDPRRPARVSDVLLTSVAMATRDLPPLFVGAVLAGLLVAVPAWFALLLYPAWLVVWFVAPWLTSGMLVHRYARLSPGVPLDPREGPLPKVGVLLLGASALVATLSALALLFVRLGDAGARATYPLLVKGLLVSFAALLLAWLAVSLVLARSWARARAVRWALSGATRAAAAFSGALRLDEDASVRVAREGLEVRGGVWVVGADARVRIPPGIHRTPEPLELAAGALVEGTLVTVVGTFRSVAQPGLRAASLDWPEGATLLVGALEEAQAVLARRATRVTVALLLPVTLLATVLTGGLMLFR